MKFFYLLVFIFFFNCNKQDNLIVHGVSNLSGKINDIKINYSNENDIKNLIGPPLIIDSFDKRIWSYFEVRKKVNLFGNKKLVLNDILILKFNDNGVLIDYQTYDINSLKKIDISQEVTEINSINHGFVNTFLTTARKRLDISRNRMKSNEQ